MSAAQSPAFGLAFAATSSVSWRRRTLAILLMAIIASIFWVDSRYPALVKRYHAGAQVKAAGALTFGVVYQVDRSMPLATRVWRTTVNWLDANRIGMTFSFLFGPAALTFLAMLPKRRTRSRYLNTLVGAAAGVPMAVCTNCIAPIARGLYGSGMSRETVLAAMFASPALNVVVLAMTFTLFPLKIALLKLATVFFLIFVFAPLVATRSNEAHSTYACPIEIRMAETWPQALAGEATLLGIVLVSFTSAFLPVPMAFDVAIAYIFMTHGAPLPYVVAILCTLGILSVYSASVVGKTISWRVAASAYATVTALGITAALVSRLLV